MIQQLEARGNGIIRWSVKNLKRLFKQLEGKLLRISPARLYSDYHNRMFDRKYGLETNKIVEVQELDLPKEMEQHATRYQGSKIRILRYIFNQLSIRYEEFTFIDFGSGKGRALLIATDYGFKRIIGIEISLQLHEISQENLQKYRMQTRRGDNIELHCMDVINFDFPDEKTLFYLYNPFDREITATVLKKIEKSLEVSPREIFLVYVFPLCIDLLDSAQFLQLEKEGKMCGDHYRIYRALTLG